MIRVLIVDDHPAVLNGLVGALRSEPGLVPLATATGIGPALDQAERHGPDVALLDYQLADGDGLALCNQLKLQDTPPAVLIYSGYARGDMALAARVAGADGILDKGAPLDALFTALRSVARGGSEMPSLRPEQVEREALRLDPADLPILGMRLDGASPAEIASALKLGREDLSRRVDAMLGRLEVHPQVASPDGESQSLPPRRGDEAGL